MTPAKIPDFAWGPLAGGILILAVGLIALAAGQVWLFPSLGPTVYLQVVTPQQPSAKIYAVLVGHAIGVAAAAVAVAVTGASHTPPVMSSGVLSPERVWASVVAIILLILGEKLAKAGHPPAAATALLITLGGLGTAPKDLLAIAAGVLIVAILGEILRRLRSSSSERTRLSGVRSSP
jgi:hypothetical protein